MGLFKFNRIQALTYGLPLLVVLSSIVIALSPLLTKYPDLAIGITYDLVLTAPLLFLLLSRKSSISKLKVVPFFIGGTLIASYVLPQNGQTHLNFIMAYAVPVVELTVLVILIVKVRKGIKIFRSHTGTSGDFLKIVKKSAVELLGKSRFATFISSEIAVMYYALFCWGKKKSLPNELTGYKENASIAMAAALLMVIFIETFAFHVLLAKWSLTMAWILTATSIYTALLIFAHIKALLQRPSLLNDEKLILKNGLIADISIDLAQIAKVESCTKELKLQDNRIANLGISKESNHHNVALYFKNPQTIEKMYGFTEECDVLLVHMDNGVAFVDKVNAALEKPI